MIINRLQKWLISTFLLIKRKIKENQKKVFPVVTPLAKAKRSKKLSYFIFLFLIFFSYFYTIITILIQILKSKNMHIFADDQILINTQNKKLKQTIGVHANSKLLGHSNQDIQQKCIFVKIFIYLQNEHRQIIIPAPNKIISQYFQLKTSQVNNKKLQSFYQRIFLKLFYKNFSNFFSLAYKNRDKYISVNFSLQTTKFNFFY
eukprot:TRINITY_DN19296_c0_g1_i2.p1 TRINITY_DN19296_c0_g1~~TRINITY_DN19296_c0_g1_i2.p1  ORF type:complete len:203 (-),score=-11.31 TRINITY_DN19296_c0_g1_i2:366-974(-)